MKWFSNLPFRFRIFLGCVLVAIVPLFLSSALTVRAFQLSLNRQIEQEGQLQLEEMSQRLGQLLDNCRIACENLTNDGSASWVLIDNTTVDIQKELYLSMYQAELSNSAALSIYDAGGTLRFSTGSSDERKVLPIYWGILRKAAGCEGTVYYSTGSHSSAPNEILLQAAHPLTIPKGARTGYIILDFTKANLDQLFRGLHSDLDTLLLLDAHQNPIYCSRAEYDSAAITAIIDQTRTQPSDSGETHSMWMQEPVSGYYLLLQKNAPISTSGIHMMQTITFSLALLGMALCLLISMVLSRSISHPIRQLDLAMAKVKEGDLSIRIHMDQKDELGRLAESFNQMTHDLQTYLDDTMQKQKDLNETQLRLYQSQLNPHFLYNTLDSIKWTSKIHELPEAATMAENLAVILRQSISSQPFITLAQELETLNNYIEIQKIRFSGRFLYELEIPDQLESCLIPKMILQPLVENAIIHGLEGSENGYICVYAIQTGTNLLISVTDDGCGMGAEMMEWINSETPSCQEGHLGLYNVIQILKLYYGPEYGLKAILSAEGGTAVTVTLPVQTKEVPYV